MNLKLEDVDFRNRFFVLNLRLLVKISHFEKIVLSSFERVNTAVGLYRWSLGSSFLLATLDVAHPVVYYQTDGYNFFKKMQIVSPAKLKVVKTLLFQTSNSLTWSVFICLPAWGISLWYLWTETTYESTLLTHCCYAVIAALEVTLFCWSTSLSCYHNWYLNANQV